ncbi:AraC family transcriptional regulator [Paenibacillus sp. J5C_2022]|uniref:AraC family transcriptional regulator n=1 Tax=Paenibacillus sp. J5C2022 TaxID=2977129 RepID=UPI0021D1B06D|nr:AraC family transcriptional regulator [Paenibacillus sp. J5C2022]MCU6707991.1 AraC family transcriptional regulator [Paenibacillus sp. J5C2022]
MTILISYCLILLVPTFAGGIGYRVLEKTLIRNVNQSNYAMMEQVQQLVDSRMIELHRMSLQLALNPNVQWLINNPDSPFAQLQLRQIGLIQDMQALAIASDFLDSFFIYFEELDSVITPTLQSDQKLYFKRIQHFEHVEDMSGLLSQYHPLKFRSMAVTENDSTRQKLAYIQSLPLQEKSNPQASLVVLIDEQKILDILQLTNWDDNRTAYIFDQNGQLLVSSANQEAELPALFQTLKDEETVFTAEENGKRLLVSSITGDNGWTYRMVTPESFVMAPIHQVKLIFLLLLAASVAAGLAISCYMAYRHYRPLRELLKLIGKRHGHALGGHANEYEVINRTLIDAFEEKSMLKSKLQEQAPLIQSNFISRLMKGSVDMATLDQASLDFMKVELTGKSFRVILLDIEDGRAFMKSETEQELALIRFILSNLSMELMHEQGYVVELERNRLAILELMESDREPRGTEWIYELKRLSQERFNLKMTIAVSLAAGRPEDIGKCYIDALLALERRIVIGHNSVIVSEPGQHEQSMYHYPIEFEALLMNYAKTGDYEQAANLLTQIYDTNFASGTLSPEMTRFLFFDLLGTLLKLAHGTCSEENRPSELADPASFFTECHTADEMLKKLQALLARLCAHAGESRSDQGQRLYDGITTYIHEHYDDGNLSLTLIADHFQLTPQYLSSFFKKYSGQNLSHVISEYRVAQAKRMLGESALTISEISRKVGYSNHIGFGRVFKKIVGLTPSQYRETLDNAR